MITAILQHEVENFDRWYEAFQKGEEQRAQHGIRIKGVYRSQDNPNYVTVLSEADSDDNYNSLFSDPVFAESMRTSGVLTPPAMHKMRQVN